ncbi:hypothetical protein GF359_02140 [candidate division WOR-3 bacterium]|uniref:Uncharacterized protein n=1 Tax=candidate division WOR-3 bacterium TaxID=2052148 RepID=A0A9D5K7W6_UNCW3|nr:hypothetical protein [candidate division WOR-3 bacterium]MBD3363993.1 hypothetical protein [candidate division WOR-3 bacterium]
MHVDAGLAAMKVYKPYMDTWGYYDSYGARGDVNLRYGFNDYLGVHIRGAIGGSKGWFGLFLDAGAGVQGALPLGPVTLALNLELSDLISPTLLLGIGEKEWLTLGVRTQIPGIVDEGHPEYGPYLDPYPIDVFAGIHVGRWNVFAGSQMFRYSYNDEPVFTAGIGYTFGPIVRRAKL